MRPLQRVGPEDEAAVLAFETANRAYFIRSISDRGDAYFEQYPLQHRVLLAAQQAGTSAFYLAVDDDGAVVGRFNLYDITDATAAVGYRVAERAAGQGLATAGVRALCAIAGHELGLATLTAATSNENLASQRVLVKAGFAYVGPTEVAGRPGKLFSTDLVSR